MPKMHAVLQEGRVRQYTQKSGETFKVGAFVLLDGTPEVTEAGADPATILGFCLHPGGDDGSIPDDTALIAIFEEDTLFWLDGDNAPVATDINVLYGVAKDADGVWHLDGTDISNTRVEVVDVDTDRKRYLCKALDANRQLG